MYPFIQNSRITDLGFGGGLALWGIRAIVSGRADCCRIKSGFHEAFAQGGQAGMGKSKDNQSSGRLAVNALKSFSVQLSGMGRRNIIMAQSGCMRLTADELSLIGVLSAAQAGREDLSRAHLMWILSSKNTDMAYRAAQTYGYVCTQSHINIDAPACEISIMDGKPCLDIPSDNVARLQFH